MTLTILILTMILILHMFREMKRVQQGTVTDIM